MINYSSSKLYKKMIEDLKRASSKFNEMNFKEFIYRYYFLDDKKSEEYKEKNFNYFGLWSLVDKLPSPPNIIDKAFAGGGVDEYGNFLGGSVPYLVPIIPSNNLELFGLVHQMKSSHIVGNEFIQYLVLKYYSKSKIKSYY